MPTLSLSYVDRFEKAIRKIMKRRRTIPAADALAMVRRETGLDPDAKPAALSRAKKRANVVSHRDSRRWHWSLKEDRDRVLNRPIGEIDSLFADVPERRIRRVLRGRARRRSSR